MVVVRADSCVVTTRVLPEGDTLWIRLIGAIDVGSALALSRAIDRVRDARPGTVLIDLGGVTFAGAVLVHFLIAVRAVVGEARICLLRASPLVQVVVAATGADKFVTLAEDLAG